MIWTRVLLPDPFRPIIPRDSDFLISKETSLSAKKSSVMSFLFLFPKSVFLIFPSSPLELGFQLIYAIVC